MMLFSAVLVWVVIVYFSIASYIKHFFAISEKIKEIDKFISNCDLNRLMQELIGNYIMMEEFFMREMVLKVCYKILDKSKTQTFIK